MLPSIIKIISGTPIWVWFVFCYLIFKGIRAIKSRVVYIPKLFIIPIILSGLKYKTFMSGSLSVWLGYFICLSCSIFLSYKYSTAHKIQVIKKTVSVKLPGTYSTLILLMAFFIIKYIFGYISATNPLMHQKLQIFEVGISGVFSGYFFGKAIGYVKLYRN